MEREGRAGETFLNEQSHRRGRARHHDGAVAQKEVIPGAQFAFARSRSISDQGGRHRVGGGEGKEEA